MLSPSFVRGDSRGSIAVVETIDRSASVAMKPGAISPERYMIANRNVIEFESAGHVGNLSFSRIPKIGCVTTYPFGVKARVLAN